MPNYYDVNRGRSTPMENALSGMAGMQDIFAKQQKIRGQQDIQEEQNKLRKVMEGQDWKNPDVGRIMAVAPKIGMAYIQQLGKMNHEQRLAASEKAKEGMEYFTAALPRLRNEPGSRQEVIDNLTKMGVLPELTNLIPKYSGDQKQWQQSIDLMIAPIQGLQQVAVQSNLGAKKDLETLKHQHRVGEIQERTSGQLQVMDKKMALEQVAKTSKPALYEDEGGIFHEVRVDPHGKVIDAPMPKGYKPFKPSAGGGKTSKGGAKTAEDFINEQGGAESFKPGTYKDAAGNLHYITTKEQYDELNR